MLLHKGTESIHTERLLLRKFELNDSFSVHKNWASDPLVQRAYHEPVYETFESVHELIEKYISLYKNDDYYRWAVILKDNNECIGQIAFFLVDGDNMICEIEYCLSREFQNKGFTTEAVKAVTRFGFEEVKFNRIQVSHRHTNSASKRVIEKSGFKYEGTLRQYFRRDGAFYDRLYYSLLLEEWKSQVE